MNALGRALLSGALLAGLAGCETRFDPDEGHFYTCVVDGGPADQCPGTYSKCGLDGYCRDPNAPGAWLCAADSDCPDLAGQQWRCGPLNGFDDPFKCYDRLQVAAIPCRYGEGVNDCHPDWKCGVDRYCHDRTPRAYGCFSDDDCEAGWRCGLDAICHDTAAEALLAPLPARKFVVEKISPQLPRDPTDFALDFDQNGALYAVAHDGGFTYARMFYFGALQGQQLVFGRRIDFPMSGAPSAVAVSETEEGYSPYVLAGDRLRNFGPALSAEGKAKEAALLMEGASLRHLSEEGYLEYGEEAVVAFKGDRFSIFTTWLEHVSSELQLWEGQTPLTLHDMIDVAAFESQSCSGTCAPYLAATSAGLFYAPRGPDGWVGTDALPAAVPEFRPIHHPLLPNAACGGTAEPVLRLRHYESFDEVFIGAQLDEEGAPRVQIASWDPEAPAPQASCSDFGFQRVSTCPACPVGGRLIEYAVDQLYDEAEVLHLGVLSRCEIPTGEGGFRQESWRTLYLPDGQCQLEPAATNLPEIRLRPSDTTPREVEYVDSAGRPWGDSQFADDPVWSYPMMLVRRPPHVLLTDDAQTVIGLDSYEYGQSYYTETTALAPGIGLVLMGRDDFCLDADELIAGVSGRAEWFVAQHPFRNVLQIREVRDLHDHVLDGCQLQTPIAELQGSEGVELRWPNRAPVFAFVREGADGSVNLVVGAGDRIWTADLSASLEAEPRTMALVPVSTVPLPFARIQSLTLTSEPEDAKSVITGYTLVNGRLFRMAGPSLERFVAREVELEEDLISVFSTGAHARVGTRQGDVYSLPTPVVIGRGPLAPDDPEASDYASVCGDVFAAGKKGLYRLEQGPGAVGSWRKVDLSHLLPDDPLVASFEDSRFYAAKNATFLFLRQGLVFKLGYEGC